MRITYIDRLRGFAILMVVMGHVLNSILQCQGSILYTLICAFHVPLLFFLSGVVITPPTISLRKCIKKALSFLQPFLIVGCAFALFSDRSVIDLFYHPYNLGYWYLLVLAIYYGCLILFSFNKFKCSVYHLLFDIIASFSIYILFVIIFKIKSDVLEYQLMTNWPFFIIGYLLRSYNLFEIISTSNYAYSVCLLFSLVIVIYFGGQLPYKYAHYIIALSIIFCLVYLFRYRANATSVVESQLAQMGRYSLDIYIYHYFVKYIIHLPMVGEWFSDTENYLLELFLTFVLATIIMYFSLFIGWIIRKSIFLNIIIYNKKTYASKNLSSYSTL